MPTKNRSRSRFAGRGPTRVELHVWSAFLAFAAYYYSGEWLFIVAAVASVVAAVALRVQR